MNVRRLLMLPALAGALVGVSLLATPQPAAAEEEGLLYTIRCYNSDCVRAEDPSGPEGAWPRSAGAPWLAYGQTAKGKGRYGESWGRYGYGKGRWNRSSSPFWQEPLVVIGKNNHAPVTVVIQQIDQTNKCGNGADSSTVTCINTGTNSATVEGGGPPAPCLVECTISAPETTSAGSYPTRELWTGYAGGPYPTTDPSVRQDIDQTNICGNKAESSSIVTCTNTATNSAVVEGAPPPEPPIVKGHSQSAGPQGGWYPKGMSSYGPRGWYGKRFRARETVRQDIDQTNTCGNRADTSTVTCTNTAVNTATVAAGPDQILQPRVLAESRMSGFRSGE